MITSQPLWISARDLVHRKNRAAAPRIPALAHNIFLMGPRLELLRPLHIHKVAVKGIAFATFH
jgi:hypothetical protein